MPMIQFGKNIPQTSKVNPVAMGLPLIFEGSFAFDHSTIIPKCEEYIKTAPGFGTYHPTLEVGNAGSSVEEHKNNPHTWPELKPFMNWVANQAVDIFKIWGHPFDDIIVSNSWVNRHRKGGWTNFHSHDNASLVVAAYLKVPPNSGNLIMVDPLEYHWHGLRVKMGAPLGTDKVLPVKTNKVYFFAPFLRHGTEQSKSDDDRWVLSINLSTIMKLNDKEYR